MDDDDDVISGGSGGAASAALASPPAARSLLLSSSEAATLGQRGFGERLSEALRLASAAAVKREKARSVKDAVAAVTQARPRPLRAGAGAAA